MKRPVGRRFSLETLHTICEGDVAEAVAAELLKAAHDMRTRNDTRPRQVTLKMTFKPRVRDAGPVLECTAIVQVGSKLPPRQILVDMGIDGDGQMTFDDTTAVSDKADAAA